MFDLSENRADRTEIGVTQEDEDMEFRESVMDRREQTDKQNMEIREGQIEEEVKSMIIEGLRAKLKFEKQSELDVLRQSSGDITGTVSSVEEGQKAMEKLFSGASEGSEEKMAEGLRKLCTETLKTSLPFGDVPAFLNAVGVEIDNDVDTNMDEYYKEYIQGPGEKEYMKAREQVKLKYKEE